jgi:hypothetical protein
MSPALQVTLSGGLSFGLPLVLALHELIALRRRHGPPGDGSGKPPEPGPKPAPSGIGNLPICLIPTAQWRAPGPRDRLASPVPVREPA